MEESREMTEVFPGAEEGMLFAFLDENVCGCPNLSPCTDAIRHPRQVPHGLEPFTNFRTRVLGAPGALA